MIDRQELVAYLHIYTWQGVSFGAQHWYGELQHRDHDTVKVRERLTERHATLLNKENYRRGFRTALYNRGFMYDGFLDRDKAVRRGIRLWQKVWPDTVVLLEGRSSSASPAPILRAPKGVDVKVLNEMAAKFPEMGWYKARYEQGAREHNDILDNISERWHDLLNRGLVCQS